MHQTSFEHKRQLIVTVGLVAVTIIAGALVYWQRFGHPLGAPTTAWHYDLNTGRLFTAPIDSIPPISAPSGPLPDGSPAGVRAHVFTCTTCAEKDRVVAFLETRTAESQRLIKAAQQLARGGELSPEMFAAQAGEGILVKRPQDKEWLDRTNPEAQRRLREFLSQLCPDQTPPRPCSRGDR